MVDLFESYGWHVTQNDKYLYVHINFIVPLLWNCTSGNRSVNSQEPGNFSILWILHLNIWCFVCKFPCNLSRDEWDYRYHYTTTALYMALVLPIITDSGTGISSTMLMQIGLEVISWLSSLLQWSLIITQWSGYSDHNCVISTLAYHDTSPQELLVWWCEFILTQSCWVWWKCSVTVSISVKYACLQLICVYKARFLQTLLE